MKKVLVFQLISLLALFEMNCSKTTSEIVLEPNLNTYSVIKKVPVVDCLAVRGFLGTPVDGALSSWMFRGAVVEYPDIYDYGHLWFTDTDSYLYNNNDGLHITLSDTEGFDAVVLRGGAYTTMFINTSSLIVPRSEIPVWEFQGAGNIECVRLNKRIMTDKISLFETRDGTISDIGFYRIEKKNITGSNGKVWTPGSETIELSKPESNFAPESLYLGMNDRYPERERKTYPLLSENSSGSPIEFREYRAIHFITPPFEEETGLDAVAVDIDISGASNPFTCTAVVQDPLNPQHDLLWVNFKMKDSGKYHLLLDIPDQVLLKGSSVWITLRFDSDLTLSGYNGGAPEFKLLTVPRDKALPEAITWRKLLLKSFFNMMSESRPWGSYRNQSREEFYARSGSAALCSELFMTIDQCHSLDPADDTVRQYYEWVYARNLPDISDISPPPEPPNGVPAWAWYPRLAWLEVRRIAQWWVDERMVPTGEFGGDVGDDSDLYQQFLDLPFYERDGLAAQLLDSAARFAELADRNNLREGVNKNRSDVLHAYEEGINHLALMARWFYGDPIYFERCMESARNMVKLTILTEDGRRHFRDRNLMGCGEIFRPPEPKNDGHADPFMWQATLQAADYNRNPEALRFLQEWGDSWLRFMKPGQWATEVEVLTGKVISFSENQPLSGGYRAQATVFTWLFSLTGDKRYLEPFLYYYRQAKAPSPSNQYLGEAFTLGLLDELDSQTIDTLAEHNQALKLYRTGDTNPIIQDIIGNPKGRSQGIGTLYDARRWPDMYTSTHQFTDRIFPNIIDNASISYLGGYCLRNKFNPTLAVSWEGFGTDYGAMVFENSRNRVKVLVYNFASEPMTGNMSVWALEHGRYTVSIGRDTDGDKEMDNAEKTEILELAKADTIELTLPPKTVTVVEIDQIEKLDSIFTRADLAIAAREVEMKENILTCTIHNIGSADISDVVVAVVDAQGNTIIKKSLGSLPAPLDLIEKRIPCIIRMPHSPDKGWKLVLDPDNHVPEIYEGNNEVDLDKIPAVNYARGWE